MTTTESQRLTARHAPPLGILLPLVHPHDIQNNINPWLPSIVQHTKTASFPDGGEPTLTRMYEWRRQRARMMSLAGGAPARSS